MMDPKEFPALSLPTNTLKDSESETYDELIKTIMPKLEKHF